MTLINKTKLERIQVIDMAWWFINQNINPEESKEAQQQFDQRSLNEVIEKYLVIKQEIKDL